MTAEKMARELCRSIGDSRTIQDAVRAKFGKAPSLHQINAWRGVAIRAGYAPAPIKAGRTPYHAPKSKLTDDAAIDMTANAMFRRAMEAGSARLREAVLDALIERGKWAKQ